MHKWSYNCIILSHHMVCHFSTRHNTSDHFVALFFWVLNLTFKSCFGSMWPLPSRETKICRFSKIQENPRQEESRERNVREGDMAVSSRPKAVLENYSLILKRTAPKFYLSCLHRLDFPSRVFIHSNWPCIQISSSKVAYLYFWIKPMQMFADGYYMHLSHL